jgi:hypothetical protein
VVLPAEFLERFPTIRALPDAGRGMGLFILATRGAGKSRLLGRLVAYQDLLRGVPLVVLDPIGGLIDNLLDKLSYLPVEVQQRLWPRVRYVNLAGQDGRVVPWPIYPRAGAGSDLYERSQPLVDVLRRADPALATASIQGLNRLAPLASALGMVLAALELGITEADSLLTEPHRWQTRLSQLADARPECAQAVVELRKLYQLAQTSPREFEVRIEPLRNKLAMFRLSPTMRATFGAVDGGIDWQEVVDTRQTVLLDLRDVRSTEAKKFCLLWAFTSVLAFIKARGHGRHRSLSLIFDEIAYLIGSSALNTDVLTADLDELVNRIARSHAVWVTLATQELYQLPEGMRKTLLSLGNVIYGRTSDPGAAADVVTRYYPYDPHWVRKRVPHHTVLSDRGRVLGSVLVDVDTVEYTLEEQIALWSRTFLTLPTFEFLVGASAREGTLPTELVRLTIRNVDRGRFVNEPLTAAVRSLLMRRDGAKLSDLLAEIASRTGQAPVATAPDDQPPRLLCAAAAPPAAPTALTGSPGEVPITRYHGEE